jgi:hypothetical protein
MSKDILGGAIPREVGGHHVLVHFASYKDANIMKYADDGNIKLRSAPAPKVEVPVEEPREITGADIAYLVQELDRLEKMCGTNILQDIFYEVHDGPNAITNLSSKFPDVRKTLDLLYKDFGFDVIYEELDG